jgi:hypothetical protein
VPLASVRAASRRPAPAALLGGHALAEGGQGPTLHGSSRRIPVVELRDQAVEQDVGRARNVRRRGRGGGPRDLQDAAARAGQAPGEDRGRQRVQVRGAGQALVDRLEAPGRLQQQRRGIAAPAGDERELGPDQVSGGPLAAGERAGLGHGQQVPRGGGPGPVPGTAVGIEPRIGGLGQGAVRLLPLSSRPEPVGRRPGQRMPEPHPGAEFGQADLGRGRRRLDADPEAGGRPPHQCRIAGRIGRREQQQPAGWPRQSTDPAREAGLDAARERCGAGKPEAAGQLGHRQSPGQFQQRQRVATRLGDDLIANVRVDRPGQRLVEQRPGIGLRQAPDPHLRQP